MKKTYRAGRSWIPAEWRQQVRVPRMRRTAMVLVTGVTDRHDAADVLAAHLPIVPVDALDPDDPRRAALADGPGGGEDADDETTEAAGHVEDTDAARRIASRISRLAWIRTPDGVRQLVNARAVNPGKPAVYAWRRTAHGQDVYRIWHDGTCELVATFTRSQKLSPSGHMRPYLTAQRYYT
jgi:hypothetical protein